MAIYEVAAIYEIAHHIGFEDAQYFARVFKKLTGLTPTQYLNRQTIQ